MRILEEDPSFYRAWEDEETGEYYLEVEGGRTAVFLLKIRLSAEEVARYREDAGALRELAWRIVDAPDDFLPRRV